MWHHRQRNREKWRRRQSPWVSFLKINMKLCAPFPPWQLWVKLLHYWLIIQCVLFKAPCYVREGTNLYETGNTVTPKIHWHVLESGNPSMGIKHAWRHWTLYWIVSTQFRRSRSATLEKVRRRAEPSGKRDCVTICGILDHRPLHTATPLVSLQHTSSQQLLQKYIQSSTSYLLWYISLFNIWLSLHTCSSSTQKAHTSFH